MKVTNIYVYPIKALRGIPLPSAALTPQGIQHDRRFMLWRMTPSGEPSAKVQLDSFPRCSRFTQHIVGDTIVVTYLGPGGDTPVPEGTPKQLHVPLQPDRSVLERQDVSLHHSMVLAYRMGPRYDEWFSTCFGFDTALFYIGDERRPILGTFAPQTPTPDKGWLSTISSYVVGEKTGPEPHWLGFSDMAPYLVTTEASLRNVRARVSSNKVDMRKFRPNIVVDGEGEFDEDFWEELSIDDEPVLTMTKMCNRCQSLNVDYDTGAFADGEPGTLLKKLMSDRRVDPGSKYTPVFGHYGFLTASSSHAVLRVGDDVSVTKRVSERPAWDWPAKSKKDAARYYRYT